MTATPAGGGTAGSAATPMGSAGQAGSATATAPFTPPPGTDKLVPVPDAIASKLELVKFVGGLSRPVLLTFAPGDARKRLFVLEQHKGTIRVVENAAVSQQPFLTVRGISEGYEQGLLGLAFHPKFAENGKLYVNYTAENKHTHVDEYRVSKTDPDAVDPASKREIIVIEQPYSNHNGGGILFGPDGKLWVGMGDGGSAGDPLRAGQDPKQLLAKMLRFDVDAAKPVPEIVHMGVRNPWRFWFDMPTGSLYIGDVGQNLWEYVFAVKATDGVKHNFGWNVVEGNHCYLAKTCKRDGFTPAVVDYPHDQGCSITGGVTYRGKAIPELDGRYFYADFCTGLLRSFLWTADPAAPRSKGFVRDHWDWKAKLDRNAVLQEISSFGVDADGEMYILSLRGSIYKLAPKK